jgi:hypothetical protein
MKKTVKKSIPKAQLGTIAKTIAGAVKGAVKGGKTAYTKVRAAKKAAETERYGDYGQYARLEDMKRSEAYRRRDGTGSNSAIPIGTAGALGSSNANKKKVAANKAKVQANKAKVKANAAKYKKAYGGTTKPLTKAQKGGNLKEFRNKDFSSKSFTGNTDYTQKQFAADKKGKLSTTTLNDKYGITVGGDTISYIPSRRTTLDTSGYSKGKKEFPMKTGVNDGQMRIGYANPYSENTVNVPRKDVPKLIANMKKGTGPDLVKKSEANKKKIQANAAKVAANKKKVEANAAKYKKAYGGSTKPLEKAQLGKIVKMASTALKGSSKFPEQKTLTKAAAELNVKNKKNIKNIQKNYNKPMPKFPKQEYVTKEQVMKNMAKRKSKNK